MTNQVIPAEAVEAARKVAFERYGTKPDATYLRAALEAAAPYVIADHLLTLAADVKARGDVGKDEGLEAWDYLTWKAKQLRTTK